MGGKVKSLFGSRTFYGSITAVLASALLEWLLIIMLLINAIFGYLITKFARYCELPIPCLLCSRIDNILGKEKAGFYWDMICGRHKKEISSLVYCHFHEKLVDVRGMCETCLFSFATKDKSNAETYRLLVGKLGEEDPSGLDEDPLLDNQMSMSSKHCSCCKELWSPKRQTQTLLQTRSFDLDVARIGYPTNHTQHQDSFEKEAPGPAVTQAGEKRKETLVHLGYTELKISSDTESEIEASDVEDSRALISDDPLRDLILDTPEKPFISVTDDDSVSEKTDDLGDSLHDHSPILSDLVQSDIVQPHDISSILSATPVGHGLEELNWQKIVHEPNESASAEHVNVIYHVPNPVLPAEMNSHSNLHSIEDSGSIFPDLPKDESDTNEVEVMPTSVNDTGRYEELENLQITANPASTEVKPSATDTALKMPDHLDLSDAYKLAISARGRQVSEKKLSEQLSGKDSSTNADLKLLLSQFSQGFNLPSTGILSPRVSRNFDELKNSDSSSSVGMKLLQKKFSLERSDSRKSLDRNESGVESLDFSTVSEIEGESELDRLKRQLEHDRRFMIALLKELDEERNASAVSAYETMAMITRLQEEKAALQMEASHGLRMMEEQAEYDMDALDKLNELITEKEKEILDLEAELEYYRRKYPNELFLDNVGESGSESLDENKRSAPNCINAVAEDAHTSEDSYPEVDDENEYLSQYLRSMEEKLSIFCRNLTSGMMNAQHLEKQVSSLPTLELIDDGHQVKRKLEENIVVSPKDSSMSEECHQNLVRHTISFKKSKSIEIPREADVTSIVGKVSRLNESLQALEADRSFIERVTNVLCNGEVEMVHEIVSHLRDLCKIGIRRYQC